MTGVNFKKLKTNGVILFSCPNLGNLPNQCWSLPKKETEFKINGKIPSVGSDFGAFE